MEQTIKYIGALRSVGYSNLIGNLSGDWKAAYNLLINLLDKLEALDKETLWIEATIKGAKETLERYTMQGADYEYKLDFVDNGWKILLNLSRLYRGQLKDYAKDCLDKKLWTWEQYREFRLVCDNIPFLWYKRLKEFATAYELIQTRAQAPKNIRKGGRKSLQEKPKPIEKQVTESDIIGEPLFLYRTVKIRLGWLAHLQAKNAVWKSVDLKTFRKALQCGDVATISTGINKPILVGFFKVFAFGYAPEYSGYAETDEEKEKYKSVCMQSAGFDKDQWQKSGVGKLKENEKKALFPEK